MLVAVFAFLFFSNFVHTNLLSVDDESLTQVYSTEINFQGNYADGKHKCLMKSQNVADFSLEEKPEKSLLLVLKTLYKRKLSYILYCRKKD